MKFTDIKFVVVAKLKDDVAGLLSQADGVSAALDGHPDLFPNAAPVSQAIKDARKALGSKSTSTSGLKKSAQARSTEERTLRNSITDGARFVETCANKDPANGSAIIAASTFSQKIKRKRNKAPLTLKYGGVSGAVLADAKAAARGRAFYAWRYSLDNGQTWVEVAQTNDSKTVLEGLPIGKIVLVQVAITQKNVRSAWSGSENFQVR